MPNTTSITAMSQGCPSSSVMNPSRVAPTITAGIVPTTSAHASRWSVVSIRRAEIERTHAPR